MATLYRGTRLLLEDNKVIRMISCGCLTSVFSKLSLVSFLSTRCKSAREKISTPICSPTCTEDVAFRSRGPAPWWAEGESPTFVMAHSAHRDHRRGPLFGRPLRKVPPNSDPIWFPPHSWSYRILVEDPRWQQQTLDRFKMPSRTWDMKTSRWFSQKGWKPNIMNVSEVARFTRWDTATNQNWRMHRPIKSCRSFRKAACVSIGGQADDL